jgi:hypothetical protein
VLLSISDESTAALTWCGHKTRGRCFIGSDGELTKAAETEGFTVVCLT